MLMLHEDSVQTMSTMQQQCNVHGAKLTLTKFCVGLTTAVNLTMPCPLAIRTLCLA